VVGHGQPVRDADVEDALELRLDQRAPTRRTHQQALLARHGFRVVRTDHFCLEQDPFGWLQSLYNAAGFPTNLLYDLLKAPSARDGTARAHRVAGALTMIPLLPLLVLALLLTILDAALRQGGTVELYAVKAEV